MNPVSVLGLTASIIACIQLAQALSKEVGLSEHNRTDLERMLRTLRRFLASYQGLKNIAAIDESGGRFCLVKQAEQPWKESQEIINEVQQRLEEKNLFNQWIRGGVPGTGKSTNVCQNLTISRSSLILQFSLINYKSLLRSKSTPSRLYATFEISRKMRRELKTT
ncbi:hypothetical protein BCIN_08g01100 [Botrytis cinerea B05.10]|uniref:Fungal N-terminal domain-containing protein n=3 Tax=Botryotinia fuckeliana TaxID=40559 RepID=A0A384JPS9_BOTFB|nr:hypothetical protein BCIN_08g01100 [Botrytis cinerea B05.10]ATZ52364.1 hypothetical protein BCIN_08g01100 [Botrytis cinerea B05.10]EMR81534.1 hypothetical protein BcDW1_9867 [Botrytis cinerea BcDW1]CCD43763.1 hypothetical protein BofuT4_P010110.1 [Botrytis cinerea T4]